MAMKKLFCGVCGAEIEKCNICGKEFSSNDEVFCLKIWGEHYHYCSDCFKKGEVLDEFAMKIRNEMVKNL